MECFVTNYLGLESSMYAEVRRTLGKPGVSKGTYGGMSGSRALGKPRCAGDRGDLEADTGGPQSCTRQAGEARAEEPAEGLASASRGLQSNRRKAEKSKGLPFDVRDALVQPS